MKELAEKHNVKPATLRSRKTRENWQRNATNKVATKRATKRENVATKKAIEELNDNKQLTEQQKQFCLLYLKYFNATKAYKEAYGCSYQTANTNGPSLLVKTSIQKEIKSLKEAQRSDLYIDSLDIKRQWAKQAYADVNDYVTFGKREVPLMGMFGPVKGKNGKTIMQEVNYVDFKESTELDGSLIKEVRMGKDGPVVQLYDKQKAMQELHKLMDDNNDDSSGVVFVDNEEAMNQYMAEHGEAYAD